MSLAGVAVLAALALAACSPVRGFDAALVLADLAAGPGPSWLKSRTAAPARENLTWAVDGRAGLGDLYRPREAVRAALVLVPGAAREGRDDPRLVAFATTLARAGFLVLVPELANLRELKLRPADARAIADAARAAADAAPGVPLGLGAFSYAVGPAVLAGLEPDLAPKLGFILGIGGYHDSVATIAFFTTGRFRGPGESAWRAATPNAYGKWVFVRTNADLIADRRDRTTLMAIAGRKMNDLAADVSDLVAMLGPEGRAVWDLIANAEPEAVPALVAALPEAIRADIDGLNPARRNLRGLRARLILVHGRDDPIVPWTESLALAQAAPADLWLLDRLPHVDLRPAGLLDTFRLWRATYRLLGERK